MSTPSFAAASGFAAAKINLHLHVTGRRADGYHELDSLAVFAGIGDRVTVAPADALSLTLDGPFAAGLATEGDNLVLRAARRLAEAAGVPARAALHLSKHLPVASGIGGGSADAAAALRVLCRLWRIEPGAAMLARIALELGADVPVCLASEARLMRGVGETLEAVPALPACGMLLVNPGVGVSTAAVFAGRAPGVSAPCRLPAGWADAASLADWLGVLGNDLQAPALGLCPVIGVVLAAIAAAPGCRLARMSGSGATCFGLFDSAAAAEAASLGVARPGWWAWGGGLAEPIRTGQGFTERLFAT